MLTSELCESTMQHLVGYAAGVCIHDGSSSIAEKDLVWICQWPWFLIT